ncbi:uncharacterized protein EAE98_001597 [Botrytis deweyae]|uniref:Uncharacterized protein n=1 Tax=Botrytis deweyae TaxID=2478750 RepID=A0ABQ7IZ85_9HELO|nr:uncharacterized protein EAE98_001597 [Botrytis deweyae]KAF7937283.1 hypothetical protein EAE98_001597 [Botrytis deweyae]
MNAEMQHPGSQESRNGGMIGLDWCEVIHLQRTSLTKKLKNNPRTSTPLSSQQTRTNHSLSQYNPFYLPSKTASPSPKFSPKTTYHEIPTSGPGTSSPARLLEYQTELSLLHPNGGMKSPNTFLLHPRNVLEVDKRDREKGCSGEIAARLLGN